MPLCPPLLLVAPTASVGVRAFEKGGWYTKKKKCTVSLLAAIKIAGNMPLGF
jgi:hypothetical protein